MSSPGCGRRKDWITGSSRADSSAGRDEPTRESSAVAVPSAGTGAARAMPTRYLSERPDRYPIGARGRRSGPGRQWRFRLVPFPPLPLRGRGGGGPPAGRVDPDAGRPPPLPGPLAPDDGAEALEVPSPAAACRLAAPPGRREAEAAPGRMTPVVVARARVVARPPPPAPTMAAAMAGVSAVPRSPRVSSRCRMVTYRGSRSFIQASSGEAMKIDE